MQSSLFTIAAVLALIAILVQTIVLYAIEFIDRKFQLLESLYQQQHPFYDYSNRVV